MPARTTRKDARTRLLKTMMEALDRIIPEDESKPLKGSKFIDWENQATQFKQAVIPTLLEERAALEANAVVDKGGAGTLSALRLGLGLSGETDHHAGGAWPRWTGGDSKAALPLPHLWRLFFPLRTVTGPCPSKRN